MSGMSTVEKALTSLGAAIAARPQQEEPPPKITAKVIQLPLWPEPVRGLPNVFLRSALFAAVRGKNRRYIKGEILGAVDGIALKFTGQQLNQDDLDVWEQLVHLARLHPLGNVVHFKGHAFLKSIGRTASKRDYTALNESLSRLTACEVALRKGSLKFGAGREHGRSLLRSHGRDEETGVYYVVLDEDLNAMYRHGEWTGIDFEQRRKLKGKPLAQWYHANCSSHAAPFPLKVETIQKLCGSAAKRTRKFKENLKAALADVAAVTGWQDSVDGELVVSKRTPTPAQQKHLSQRRRSKR